jgi:hypothetical protein
VVESARLRVAVPAPLALAAAHEIEPVGPGLKVSIKLNPDAEDATVGEGCAGVNPDASDYPERLRSHDQRSVRDDGGGAEPVEPAGYPGDRRARAPHMGG